FFDDKVSENDAARLRDVLDRHQMTPAEWAFLAAAERERLPEAIQRAFSRPGSRKSTFGPSFSDQECFAAFEACLRKGWLQRMDAAALEEVASLLRDEPALLPAPETTKAKEGEFDFTPAGAAVYREISGQWLGPDWEDRLYVSNCYYWIEHLYAEAEA